MRELVCNPAGETPSRILIGRGARHHVVKQLAGSTEHHRRQAMLLLDLGLAADCDLVERSDLWHVHTIAGGESCKTLAVAEDVLRAMVHAGLDRSSVMVAAGGGSIGDLGGLCAALYQRGIECWQVPTTLLAMVDSAVGGKTAVNLPEGKNLVGAVHPPAVVAVDPDFLTSLPQQQFDSGLCEAIKMGIGVDADLFILLEQQREAVLARDQETLLNVIEKSLTAKIAIVEQDLTERGERRLLNLGHTLGHALEAFHEHQRPHGHCVARGLHFAIDRAEAQGYLAAQAATRARGLLQAYGHAPSPLPPADQLRHFLLRDKKAAAGTLHFVLPTGIGSSTAVATAPEDLLAGPGWR